MPRPASHLSERDAHRVYDLLVEYVSADEDDRLAFVRYLTEPAGMGNHEWRFMGSLGFGGKLRFNPWRGAYIDCYPEDRTAERDAAIAMVNGMLTFTPSEERRLRGAA
jgi:hypothetical protein